MANSEISKDKQNLVRILNRYDDVVKVEDVLDTGLSAKSENNTLLLQILLEIACKNVEPNLERRQILFSKMWKKLSGADLANEAVFHTDALLSVRKKGASEFEKEIIKENSKISPNLFQDFKISDPFESSRQFPNNPGKIEMFSGESSLYPEKYKHEFLELNRIGKGGFGTVWKARHKVDDVTYAIKKIIFKYNQDSDYLKVIREVKSFATLNHLNVVGYNQAWLEYVHQFVSRNNGNDMYENSSIEDSNSEESTPSDETSTSSENSTLSFESTMSSLATKNRSSMIENSEDDFITFREDSKTCLKFSKSNHSISRASSVHNTSFGLQKPPTLRVMLYIQMEYCDCDLRSWLDNRANGNPLPFQLTVFEIFKDILNGVAHIHSKSIIHRDLKPQNIFYSFKNNAMKIGDFGLAALSGEENENLSTPRRSNCGTVPYSAPEQRIKHKYDYKVDMYSLGVILIELLVDAKTQMEFDGALRSILKGSIPDNLYNNWADYVELIRNLVSADPELRPTAKSVLSEPPILVNQQIDQGYLMKIKSLQEAIADKEAEHAEKEKRYLAELAEKDKRIQELEALLASMKS